MANLVIGAENLRLRRHSGTLMRALEAVELWVERARQRHELAGLGDETLKDVGLSRADVERETEKRFWQA